MMLPTDHFETLLLERRAQLLDRYRAQQARLDEELESYESEYVEHAAEQADATRGSILSDLDKRRLDAIVAALHRIEAGTYGVCLRCGEPIDRDRLEALPETPLCISCAEEVATEMVAPV